MDINWHIGDVIAKLRKGRRWNQLGLAKKVEVSKATIVRAEAGDAKVARQTYVNIARALGTNLAALEGEAARLGSGPAPPSRRPSKSDADDPTGQHSERGDGGKDSADPLARAETPR